MLWYCLTATIISSFVYNFIPFVLVNM